MIRICIVYRPARDVMGILCRDRGGGERPTQKSPTSGLIFSIFFGLIIRAIHHGENTH